MFAAYDAVDPTLSPSSPRDAKQVQREPVYCRTNVSSTLCDYMSCFILYLIAHYDLAKRVLVLDDTTCCQDSFDAYRWPTGTSFIKAQRSCTRWKANSHKLLEALWLPLYVNPSLCIFDLICVLANLISVAEKNFLNLRALAATHTQVNFIAVSHSDRTSTDQWLAALPDPSKNTLPNLEIVVDAEREAYAAWGLGTSGFWHVLGSIPSVSKLDKEEGIKVRSTESGNRWQTAGNFAVDGHGIVRWSRKDERADDLPNLKDGVRAVLAAGNDNHN